MSLRERCPYFVNPQQSDESQYDVDGVFECLPCAEGCESCEDDSPCVVSLNWLMRTAILILECCVIACLPAVALFTWKYGNVKVSELFSRFERLYAFFVSSFLHGIPETFVSTEWSVISIHWKYICYSFGIRLVDSRIGPERVLWPCLCPMIYFTYKLLPIISI